MFERPLLKWLPNGLLRSTLEGWDHRYDAESRGAHSFELAYQAARKGLGQALGESGSMRCSARPKLIMVASAY